jgi:hypothetical protein
MDELRAGLFSPKSLEPRFSPVFYMPKTLPPEMAKAMEAVALDLGGTLVLTDSPFLLRGKSLPPEPKLPERVEVKGVSLSWMSYNEMIAGRFKEPDKMRVSFAATCIRQHFGIDALDIKNRSLILYPSSA